MLCNGIIVNNDRKGWREPLPSSLPCGPPIPPPPHPHPQSENTQAAATTPKCHNKSLWRGEQLCSPPGVSADDEHHDPEPHVRFCLRRAAGAPTVALPQVLEAVLQRQDRDADGWPTHKQTGEDKEIENSGALEASDSRRRHTRSKCLVRILHVK